MACDFGVRPLSRNGPTNFGSRNLCGGLVRFLLTLLSVSVNAKERDWFGLTVLMEREDFIEPGMESPPRPNTSQVAIEENDGIEAARQWEQCLARVLDFANVSESREEGLAEILAGIDSLASAQGGSIYLYNAKRDLKCAACIGLAIRSARQIEELAQTGAARRLLAAQDSPTTIEDVPAAAKSANAVPRFLDVLAENGVVSMAVFPLVASDHLLGFLAFLHDRRRSYERDEIERFENLGRVLALALLNKQLADARVTEDKGRDNFISALSHELRTPLTSIIGFTQMIRRKLTNAPSSDNRMSEQLDIIWAQAQRLNRLIDTFVDIANIEQGNFTVKVAQVEFLSMLKAAVEQATSRLNARDIVELKLPGRPVWIRGDASRLEQVFVHIVSNAIRYSPPGTRIMITCTEHGPEGYVKVSVEDKGPGISRDLRDAIFERFYQAESLRSGGLGVGLYLSKSIIEAHGGRIIVESEPGEGTSVSVILPV